MHLYTNSKLCLSVCLSVRLSVRTHVPIHKNTSPSLIFHQILFQILLKHPSHFEDSKYRLSFKIVQWEDGFYGERTEHECLSICLSVRLSVRTFCLCIHHFLHPSKHFVCLSERCLCVRRFVIVYLNTSHSRRTRKTLPKAAILRVIHYC